MATAKEAVKKIKKSEPKKPKNEQGFFSPMVNYFKGAWEELGEVRWPTRQATIGLSIAVIIFSAFFAVLILLLDVLFDYLFKLMLG